MFRNRSSCTSDSPVMTWQPVYALEQALTKAIADAGVGVYDGHEVALLDGDDAYLFMYGPDAERLFAAVQPTLEADALLQGAKVTLRYGSSDDETASERHVLIGAIGGHDRGV